MLATILAVSSCQKADDNSQGNEKEIRYTMPAESAPHEGTWLQWPQKYQYGETYRNRLEDTWIAMAREIVSGENLHIIAYNQEAKDRIVAQLTKANIPQERIDFYLFKTNDVWVRDNGPIYVYDKSGVLTIEGWGFNGWGDKEPFNYDDKIPDQVAVAEKMPFVQLNKKMILEGGAVELDGKGSLMATRSAILNKNRNPGMTEEQANALFTTYLGATHFIWLDGVAGLDITDMHIDGFARFGENNTIVTMSPDDLATWELTNKDIATLYHATNMAGKPYNYVILPLTQNNVVTTYGKDLGYQGSYVNYYITNDKVLVPNYNDPNDAKANAIIQTLYPGRTVVGIDVRNLYANGGMVHCVTQQQPQ
ncbi:MAG: agmatine deiminase family protein [Bacteroidales bacterium]